METVRQIAKQVVAEAKQKLADNERIAGELLKTRQTIKQLFELEADLKQDILRQFGEGNHLVGSYAIEISKRVTRTIDWKKAYEEDVGVDARKKLEMALKSGHIEGALVRETPTMVVGVKALGVKKEEALPF